MLEPPETPRGIVPAGGRSGRIQSIDRAVSLLRVIAALTPGEATLQRVADETGLNRSTAWRILATLEDNGLIERRDGAYGIGLAAAQFSNAASVDGFIRRAHPVIAHLAAISGETANLAVVRRFGLYYVDQVSNAPDIAEDWLGRQIAVHATSVGKAYLSALPDDEIRDLLPGRLARYTDATVVNLAELIRELHQARRRGYATVIGELVSDTNGVAAPITDGGRPVGAVTIWGTAQRVPRTRLDSLGGLVRDSAAELAQLISRPPDA